MIWKKKKKTQKIGTLETEVGGAEATATASVERQPSSHDIKVEWEQWAIVWQRWFLIN